MYGLLESLGDFHPACCRQNEKTSRVDDHCIHAMFDHLHSPQSGGLLDRRERTQILMRRKRGQNWVTGREASVRGIQTYTAVSRAIPQRMLFVRHKTNMRIPTNVMYLFRAWTWSPTTRPWAPRSRPPRPSPSSRRASARGSSARPSSKPWT